MSSVNPVDCPRLPVTVNKDGDSEIIQDMSNLKSQVFRLVTEQNVSEAGEPETYLLGQKFYFRILQWQ